MYIKLCKICLISFVHWQNIHMSHLFILFFSSILASGGYIGEISKSALITVKIQLFTWQIMGHNQNFDLCPSFSPKKILRLRKRSWSLVKFHPWPCFVQYISFKCSAKWEISTISLSVWHIGCQS